MDDEMGQPYDLGNLLIWYGSMEHVFCMMTSDIAMILPGIV